MDQSIDVESTETPNTEKYLTPLSKGTKGSRNNKIQFVLTQPIKLKTKGHHKRDNTQYI